MSYFLSSDTIKTKLQTMMLIFWKPAFQHISHTVLLLRSNTVLLKIWCTYILPEYENSFFEKITLVCDESTKWFLTESNFHEHLHIHSKWLDQGHYNQAQISLWISEWFSWLWHHSDRVMIQQTGFVIKITKKCDTTQHFSFCHICHLAEVSCAPMTLEIDLAF